MKHVATHDELKPLSATLEQQWSVAQTKSVFEQLSGGIRYLDIRCGFVTSTQTWIVHHGVVPGNPLQMILQDVDRFLKANLKEIVVLELSEFKVFNAESLGTSVSVAQKASLVKLIKSSLGSHLASKTSASATLGTYLKLSNGHDQRAVVSTSGLGVDDSLLWEGFLINDYANTPILGKMVEHNTALVKKLESEKKKNAGKMTKLSWTLTPQSDTVLHGLEPCSTSHPRSLLELAKIANDQFPTWWKGMSSKLRGSVNVVLFDNPTALHIDGLISINPSTNPNWRGVPSLG